MKFKEWITIDEVRFKGAERAFRLAHPEMPRYVQRQLYTNRISPDFRRIVAQHNQNRMQPGIDWIQIRGIQQKISHGDELTPEEVALWKQIQATRASKQMTAEAAEPAQTIDYLSPTVAYVPSQHQNQSPGGFLDGNLKDIQWSRKPMVVQVSPLDFDQETLGKFLLWKFGFNPNPEVRQDAERFAIQQQLAQSRESNEPIILIKQGDKFKLVEGFHRTMIALLSAHNDAAGAPRQHVDALKAGHPSRSLDLSQWRRVPLLAYVGQRLA